MNVTNEDRRYMRRLGVSLRDIAEPDRGTPQDRRALLEIVNERRRADGRRPLADEDEVRPEQGIHRRARALGMARTDR